MTQTYVAIFCRSEIIILFILFLHIQVELKKQPQQHDHGEAAPPIQCHFDGLIGSLLRIVVVKWLKDLVVDEYFR